MKKMKYDIILEDETIQIVPLKESDFEMLYSVAKDPLIWAQHPNPNRYKKEIFEVYFKGAIESNAFLVFDKKQNIPIGSSRFCKVLFWFLIKNKTFGSSRFYDLNLKKINLYWLYFYC
jgi:hypothetical protein